MFPPPDLDESQLEALYAHHFGILTEIASAEFHIPKPDAEELARDILLASFKQSSRINDADAWFRGAMTFAATTYMRKRA